MSRNLVSTAVACIAITFLVGGHRLFAQTPPPVAGASPAQPAGAPPGDPLGPDLFIAIRGDSVAEVNAVLAHGARTEATNWLGITPLMWAAFLGNKPACQSLLKAGANINGPSRYGTALSFGELGGSTTVVAFLLDHGARITRDRVDEITPLMTASGSGHLEIIRLLLKHGADVNASDADGMTALMFAALRGQTAAARMLLDAGAKINAADSERMTPLMYAAESGYPQCAALLITRHAAVNLKDHSGSTALHLAAQYPSDHRVTFLLLRAGANPHLKNGKGQTASQITVARQNLRNLALKGQQSTTPAPGQGDLLAHRARAAVNLGLPLIEGSTRIFSQQATCVSCHHQGLGLMVTGLAQARGFRYDKQIAATQLNLIMSGDEAHKSDTLAVLPHPEMYKHIPTVDMGEFTTGASYLYSGLLAHRTKTTETLAANIVILASQQFPTGQWGFFVHREPIQSSAFTTTALTIRLLKAYMPKQRAAETAERIARARAWIEATSATTGDDRAFKLLGLKWSGADTASIASAVSAVRAAQRPDGGWAQMPTGDRSSDDAYTRSDAYATGQALYALNLGGDVPPTDRCYQRGVQFLLSTQDGDGSWFVPKRAIPANTYFDAGFPHGESQYMSYGASCWATMALMIAASPVSLDGRSIVSGPRPDWQRPRGRALLQSAPVSRLASVLPPRRK